MPNSTQPTPDPTLPEIPEEIRYSVGPDEDHPGFAEMRPDPLGPWINIESLPALYAAHRKQVEAQVRERLEEVAAGFIATADSLDPGRLLLSDATALQRGRAEAYRTAARELRKSFAALDTLEADRG